MKSKEESYKIDSRRRSDILNQMQMLAQSYTPEWKFDTTSPDAGSVIGLIFANQTAANIQKLNRVIEKYHTEFANMYGISLRPAQPSEAVVALTVNESLETGIPLKKGTKVIGECENGEEIIFEFLNDLYVSGARLTHMLNVSGSRSAAIPLMGEFPQVDVVNGQFQQIEDEIGEYTCNYPLFCSQGKKIHRQELVIRHPYLLRAGEDTVGLCLKTEDKEEIDTLLSGAFTFSYLTEEGLREFDSISKDGDIIFLHRLNDESGTEAEAISSIVIEKKNRTGSSVNLRQVEIIHDHQEETPDFLWNNKMELDASECTPFGRQPALYDECYIGQEYLFEQVNARVTLQFELSFEEFTIQQTAVHEPDLSIVKRKPAAPVLPLRYECWIQEVSIEYFNGKGWKALPLEHNMTSVFADMAHEGMQELTFVVPSDWEPTTQGGYEGKCIRIQIVRADNCYLQDAVYYYPILKNTGFKVQYRRKGIQPQWVGYVNGSQIEDISGKLRMEQAVNCFPKAISDGDYVYLGFDRKFLQGPISFFFEMQEQQYFHGLELAYAYSTASGFKPLKIIDQTSQMEHSGLIMFMPPTDFARTDIEGVSRYWLRIADTTGYFAKDTRQYPIVQKLYMNAVKVQNREVKEEQDYYIDRASANMHFSLHAEQILSAEIWVNEREQLSVPQMEQLLKDKPSQVRAEYNFLGEIEEFYVLWHEIENFDMASSLERCYVIDRLNHEVIFGDGITAAIPQNTRSIAFKAKVTCCNGVLGNVTANQINKFRGAVPAIDEIFNPIDAYGGNSMEEIKDALVRGSNILGARRRLVSENDYIREVKLYSNTIAQVACVTGITRNGQRDRNIISLVLLMKDYQKGSYSFRTIEEKLRKHLLQRCEMTCRSSDIQIVEPIFVKISLHIWLTVSDIRKSLEIKQHWLERITRYFEPVNENGQSDIAIGRIPGEKQIRRMLSTLEDTAYIAHYTIAASYTDETGFHETDVEQLLNNPFMICCNGEHQIHISER